jgi:hypothetical protein
MRPEGGFDMDGDAFHRKLASALGTVRDAMTKQVLTLEPQLRASDAALRLSTAGIAGAPVVEQGHVVGMVSLSDLLEREGHTVPQTSGPFLRGERHLANLTVADVMTREVVTVLGDDPLIVAVERMDAAGVNRLPVLDADDRPIGILARDDVIRAVALAVRRAVPAGVHPGASVLEPD